MESIFSPRATSLRVCVDQAAGGRISGRVYSQCLPDPIAFHDIAHLLLQMESVLDRQQFPQAFQRKRTFSSATTAALPANEKCDFLAPEIVENAQGDVCSFWITVTSRQNTSWQGMIIWSEQAQARFSSALELIRLVDEHLFPA